jgi:hypothetical protein
MGRADPGSRKRAGQRTRMLVRAEVRKLFRRHRRLVAKLAAAYVIGVSVIAVGPALYGASPVVTAFMIGILVGILPLFGYMLVVASSLAVRSLGADAEQWTAEQLAKLDRRAWRVFHDVPLRWGNVDHVAVGPGRVYAI